MNKYITAVLVAIIISLVSTVYFAVCKELDKKSDNATIMVILEQNKEQRKEDNQRREKKEAQQQKVNEQLMESIQMLLIKMVDDK